MPSSSSSSSSSSPSSSSLSSSDFLSSLSASLSADLSYKCSGSDVDGSEVPCASCGVPIGLDASCEVPTGLDESCEVPIGSGASSASSSSSPSPSSPSPSPFFASLRTNSLYNCSASGTDCWIVLRASCEVSTGLETLKVSGLIRVVFTGEVCFVDNGDFGDGFGDHFGDDLSAIRCVLGGAFGGKSDVLVVDEGEEIDKPVPTGDCSDSGEEMVSSSDLQNQIHSSHEECRSSTTNIHVLHTHTHTHTSCTYINHRRTAQTHHT